MKKFNLIATIGLSLMLNLSQAQAQSYFGTLAPTLPSASTTRQVSLGFNSRGASGTATALVSNPALCFLDKSRVNFSANLTALNWSERRTYPILDSFGDYLTDNTYVINSVFYPAYSFGLVIKPIKWLSLATSWETGYQGKFNYEEEVRGSVTGQYNRDPLVGYHRIQLENRLNQLSLGGAVKIGAFKLGGALLYSPAIENREKWEVEVIKQDIRLAADSTTTFLTDSKVQANYTGVLGFDQQVTPRLSVGLSFIFPYQRKSSGHVLVMVQDSTKQLPEIRVDQLSKIKEIRQDFVPQLKVSCAYRPVNIVPTSLMAEINYEPWSQFSQKVIPNDGQFTQADSLLYATPFKMRDIVNFRLGVEHELFTGITFRLGFFYDISPLDKDLNRTWFSGGIGSQIGKLLLDFGGTFTTCEYKYPDLFPIKSEKRLSADTVHESFFLFKINLQYSL